jgi:hypothetical protein
LHALYKIECKNFITQFWLLQTIRCTLDHYSITIEKFGVLQVNFNVIVRETRHHAQADITFLACLLSRPLQTSGVEVTLHFMHLYVLPFLTPRAEQTRQRSVLDFAGQCWRPSSLITFVAAALGLPTKLGVGRSWFFPASSIKFLTRRSLKSRWVYLAPHEDNRIQLLSTVRSRR